MIIDTDYREIAASDSAVSKKTEKLPCTDLAEQPPLRTAYVPTDEQLAVLSDLVVHSVINHNWDAELERLNNQTWLEKAYEKFKRFDRWLHSLFQ